MKKNQRLLLILFVSLMVNNCYAQKKKFKLPPQMKEVSGLYLKNANEFWWINDSGSTPTLYKSTGEGMITDSICIKGKNRDWEDLTADKLGHIYIGDFGNNANKRTDLKIYIYNSASRELDSIEFNYPDQKLFPPPKPAWNFDAEAFFWFQDSLHVFSKNRLHQGNYYTKHYVIPAKAGKYEAILRDSIYLKNRVVTGAAINEEGTSVALISYTYKKLLGFFPSSKASVFLIKDFQGSNFFNGNIYKRGVPPFIIATQYESIDFYNKDLLYVASEQTAFIKPKAKRLKLKKRHTKRRRLIKSVSKNPTY